MIRDRRYFSKTEIDVAARAQANHCRVCGEPFTNTDPPVGDHDYPWANGGRTDLANCVAVHARCNSKKNRRTLKQYQREQRLLQRAARRLADSKLF